MCHLNTCPRDCTRPDIACCCDRDHDRLVELVESGVDQRTASGIVWPECRRVSWVDLFGIDPDFCDGKDVNEWLDEQRGEA